MSGDKKSRNRPLRRFVRLMKWLVPLGIITALVLLAIRPKPVEVDVGEVTRGAMRLTIDDDGETRVKDRYTLSAPLAGQLMRIDLDPGDRVNKGEVLATLLPAAPGLLDDRARARAEAAVRGAEIAIESAETQVESRSIEADRLAKAFQRSQLLHTKGNIADAAFEEAESAHLAALPALRRAKASVEIARFDYDQAKAALLRFDGSAGAADLQGFHLPAPIDGKVLRVHEKSSRAVQAGTPLLEIGDPRELEIRIDVLSRDAVLIRSGQEVIIEHWGGESELMARVRHVEPSAYTEVSALGVDEQRVDVIADFQSVPDTASALADGFRVEARIVIWQSDDALKVPVGALFRDGPEWAVYRIAGGVARLTHLQLDRKNGEVAEVLSGLDHGDRVILHPGDRIEDGTLITPRS